MIDAAKTATVVLAVCAVILISAGAVFFGIVWIMAVPLAWMGLPPSIAVGVGVIGALWLFVFWLAWAGSR